MDTYTLLGREDQRAVLVNKLYELVECISHLLNIGNTTKLGSHLVLEAEKSREDEVEGDGVRLVHPRNQLQELDVF